MAERSEVLEYLEHNAQGQEEVEQFTRALTWLLFGESQLAARWREKARELLCVRQTTARHDPPRSPEPAIGDDLSNKEVRLSIIQRVAEEEGYQPEDYQVTKILDWESFSETSVRNYFRRLVAKNKLIERGMPGSEAWIQSAKVNRGESVSEIYRDWHDGSQGESPVSEEADTQDDLGEALKAHADKVAQATS